MSTIAIVTGGGSGIGRGIVEHLAALQYRVVILDKDSKSTAAVRQAVTQVGGNCEALIGDLTDYAATASLVETAIGRFGVPRLLVNNVGGDVTAPFLKTEPASWMSSIERNLLTCFNMHHLMLPHMIRAKGGRIVNISSDSARVGLPNVAVYAACKGAIISFTKCLAREMAPHGILMNTICPGITDTPALRTVIENASDGQAWVDSIVGQIPLGRMAVTEDFGPIVAFLAGPGGDYITGQTISINGGKTMV